MDKPCGRPRQGQRRSMCSSIERVAIQAAAVPGIEG